MTKPESAGDDYDVVISGAGLAGSAAAILLARRGVRVALLERRSDPEAYKVLCTHSITANAHPVLDELGLLPALEKAGAVRNHARWYTRWGWIEPRAAPAGPALPYAYNVRRSTLDPLIRSRAARTPGVDLLLGHQPAGLVREAGRTVGARVKAPGGEREIRARLVVGADGKDSAVAKFAEVPTRQHENGRFGYLAHFRDLPLHGGVGQAWFLEPDMAYAFPNDDGVTVLAVLPGKKRLPAFREDLEGSFLSFVRALPEAPPVDSAERISKIIGTVDYPLVTREPTAPGVALVGDAALTSDPLWGVGCGWALRPHPPAPAARPPVPGRRLRQGPPVQCGGAADVRGGGARRGDGTAHAPVRIPPDRAAALPEPRGTGQGGGRQPPPPGGGCAGPFLRRAGGHPLRPPRRRPADGPPEDTGQTMSSAMSACSRALP
ncbi:NAD(P)/FAD-dependent oxidoreductase [Streptomyces sp. NPDC012794]|uniref:NAD(P)/FAD-dependent oxidoreductase n=1 Tax=Streptomyces sp. NPDC012794 TaxID=3364850 RepID=UPI0036913819